ncbi:uncharacterized protein LOC143181775 isoform X2 [Calliopsis andreniformis]
MSRRRNFELLAFHAFGHMGKVLVELFIIGFLVGTCIAFFVVMGDLGPQIVGKVIDKNPEDIRTSLLILTSIFIVLPLGLLRNIDSLSSLCTATIIFYLCLVLKIVIESMPHIFAGDWYEHVYYWRPSGILQCIPIFSMALFCQTQLFEIYETIPNVSLEKMNEVVRGALNICTIVYLSVGFFGYIAFCTQPFSGNILMSFEPSLSSEMIKMGFVFSIAFSFPLVIFPCRASLNSLLFRRVYTHEPSINYLPETRYRCLTITIVIVSLITGILIPNIEFVLGLVGSTIGVMICLIFPAIFFISISSKHTNERLLAQVILFTGICIMFLSTYANLYALEESANIKILATTSKPVNQMNNLPLGLNKDDINSIVNIPKHSDLLPDIKEKIDRLPDMNVLEKSSNAKANDVRQEPPIPVERVVVTEKPVPETQKPLESIVTLAPLLKKAIVQIKMLDEESKATMKSDSAKAVEYATVKVEEQNRAAEAKENFVDMQKNDNLINSDAIMKEEIELAAAAEADNIMTVEKHEKLRKTLEKHKQEQLEMMQERKEILKDFKEQDQEIQRQKQMKDTQEPKKKEETLQSPDREVVSGIKNNLTSVNLKNDLNEVSLNKIQDKEENVKVSGKEEIGIKSAEIKEKPNISINKQQNIPVEENGKNMNNKALNNKINNERIEEKRLNPKGLPKGPILKALTKRVQRKSIPANELGDNENVETVSKRTDDNLQGKSNSNPEKPRIQDEYSLPIALKMQSQTKVENASDLLVNKSEETIQAIRRDILENHDREKREINVTSKESDTKVSNNNSIKNSTVDDQEKCSKPSENMGEDSTKSKEELNEKSLKNDLIEPSLIKTNVYLSEQEFPNAISVNPNMAIRGEYAKVKQRDLKSVDVEEDRNTTV